ncbi:hypothetical protein AU476_01950 [Cupriavidus sp. UYMSc13B]|nr:hypothetical protein AU476_01950 [Cupriavidus sp. UYMSc13B]
MKSKLIVALTLLALSAFSTASYARGAGGSSAGGYQGYNAYGSPYSNSMGTTATTGNHNVSGYVRDNGTYVQPHMQTNPNATRNDNYTTRGNVNPYTGAPGTKPRDGQY